MEKWPLIPVILVLGIVAVNLVWNGGHLVYGLDDAYIHMGIAKSCAKEGTWGINSGDKVSATSSFLYPLMLCAFYKIKVFDSLPLIINLLSFIGIIYYTKKEYQLSLEKMLIFSFLSFLPFLVISGMEHTLQVLLSIVFVTEILKEEPNKTLLILSSILLPFLRFESLFLIAASVFFIERSFAKKFAVFLPALMTVGILFFHYRIFGTLLPNSMLIKSPFTITSSLSIFKILLRFPYTLMTNAFFFSQYLITLSNVSLNQDKKSRNLGIMYLIAGALHSQISVVGARYFAYLQALFLLQFSKINLKSALKRAQPVVVLAFLPVILFSSLYLVRAVGAPHDIYIQQYSLSKFIESSDFDSVVLNDIGAASYYSEAKIIDLFGLANKEVQLAKKSGSFDRNFVEGLTENASIAAIYDDWFLGKIPNSFRKIGELSFSFKVISGKNKISLYGINQKNLSQMAKNYAWPRGVSFTKAP